MAVAALHLQKFLWPAASLSFCLLATKVSSIGLVMLCFCGALYCTRAFFYWMQTENVVGTHAGKYVLKTGLHIGSRVRKGDEIGTVEAQKMISNFYAPYDGTITHIACAVKTGGSLAEGAVVLTIQKDLF